MSLAPSAEGHAERLVKLTFVQFFDMIAGNTRTAVGDPLNTVYHPLYRTFKAPLLYTNYRLLRYTSKHCDTIVSHHAKTNSDSKAMSSEAVCNPTCVFNASATLSFIIRSYCTFSAIPVAGTLCLCPNQIVTAMCCNMVLRVRLFFMCHLARCFFCC